MTPGIVAVSPEDNLGHVCEALRSKAVRRVLVVDSGGRLLGIIGWADIAPVLSDRVMGRLVTQVVASREPATTLIPPRKDDWRTH